MISGRLHVVVELGMEPTSVCGDAVVLEPGHDTWTVGDGACVFIDSEKESLIG